LPENENLAFAAQKQLLELPLDINPLLEAGRGTGVFIVCGGVESGENLDGINAKKIVLIAGT